MKHTTQHIASRKQQLKTLSSSEVFAFTYDANVDRTYKLTGKTGMQNVNGGWQRFYQMENATLYASPYLVATPRGYTKHYYAGAERVASRIGGGGLADMAVMEQPEGAVIMNPLPQQYAQTGSNIPSEEEFREKERKVSRHATETARCLRAGLRTTALMEGLFTFRDSLDDEPDCYWYHTDHLGSSSWITYTDGDAVQHLHYLPFGENFVDQKSNSFDGVRYTFSAKERDTETGYSYFGSRYYSSDLSIWLSVDPMVDKYPSLSPYVYCANNPVKLVDPNGEEWEIDGYIYTPGGTCPDNVSQSTKDKWNTMNKIYGTREGKTVIDAMNKEGVCYSVSSEKCPSGPAGGEYVSDGNKTGGTIYLNGKNSDVGLLAHEMFHGYQDLNNQGSQTIHNELQARLFATDIQNQTFSPGIPQLTPKGDILPEVFSYNVNKVISGTYSSQNMQYLEDTFKDHFDGYENVKIRKEGQTDLYGTIKRIY